MSNTTLTSSIISKKALMVLENELTLAKAVNRDYSEKFGISDAKIGAVYNLRKPPRFVGRDGEALQVENATETYVPIVVNQLSGVDISFSTTDLALNVEDFSERFIVPAMVSVANKIDVALANLYTDVFRITNCGASAASYGTSGYLNDGTHNTLAAVQGQVLQAGAILTESGVPKNGRSIVTDPMSMASFETPMMGMFNPSAKISKIFEDAAVGTNVLGFDWAEDANMPQFTPLASGTFAALASAPASGATSLSITCTGTAVLPKGTILSMAGVYAINPQNRASTGRLAQFVVTADTLLSAAAVSIPIYPAYIPSGQFATCVGTPAGTATVTTHTGAVGAVGQSNGLAFNKNAFALVTVDQEIPQGVHFAAREVYKNISLRIVRQYDINSNQIPARIEVLYGVKTIYPELAVRLGG